MKHRELGLALAIAGLMVAAPAALANGYKSLESVASGSKTLIPCQGVQEPDPNGASYNVPQGQCLVADRDAGTIDLGYSLQATKTSNVVVNGTKVAEISERVYKKGSSYIIAQKLRIEGTGSYPEAGGGNENFEVNDIFRRGYGNVSNRAVAYTPAVEDKIAGLWLAGFTKLGLNQYSGSPYGLSPARSQNPTNDVIAFRSDISASDPDGDNQGESAWFMLRFTSSSGVSSGQQANVVRVRQGGEEDQDPLEATVPGYRPAS